MKNWLKTFFLSFFSNKQAREGAKMGFTSVFLSLMICLVFICIGVIGADTLPFSSHYDNSTVFKSLLQKAFANPSEENGIAITIENGRLNATNSQGNSVLVDTFSSEEDKVNYSLDGYELVVDTRPADCLAVFEAYCVSTVDENAIISYEEYLTLNDVAKLNFEFRLRYTSEELVLSESMISGFESYLNESEDTRVKANELKNKLNSQEITKNVYDREIYGLYFQSYYPSIEKYESNSKVPMLRNYYFHELIGKGKNKFLMTFDDSMVGSFVTNNGIEVFFYGFYNNLENGELIQSNFDETNRINAVDSFVKNSFLATVDLSVYIYIMNTIRLIPIIALMVVVVTMLAHSIMALYGVDTCSSFGQTIKVVGVMLWISGIVSAILSVIVAFFVQRNAIITVSIVAFFLTLLVRVAIFVICEIKIRKKEIEKLLAESNSQTEA